MRMHQKNKGVWVGSVAILVIAALVVWWLMANRPLSTSTGITNATSTETGAATGSTTSTGASSGTVSHVNRAQQTVNQVIAGLSGTSQFNALYRSTGVSAMVSANGQYTVFVPTNGAFYQLGGLIQNMSNAEKQRLVKYHVVTDRAIDVDAEIAGMVYALSGDELNFHYGPDKIPLVNSAIVITEYKAKNGVVILIDNVLLPPKKPQGAI